MNNPKEFPASHPQDNRGPNNARDHDVPYLNVMEVQDPPLRHECSVCQSRFPSPKALGGHMKRHPERPWRGLYPPYTPNASGSSVRPPKEFPSFHPQHNRGPNNARDDDLTLPEADQNTVRPKNAVTSFRAQAQQTGSNPAVTVRAQAHHDVPYLNFMELQDPPLLFECFVCQSRHPSERALCGHMNRHPDRLWRGLYPPHTPNPSGRSVPPPFFYVRGFCPPPIAESLVSTVATSKRTRY